MSNQIVRSAVAISLSCLCAFGLGTPSAEADCGPIILAGHDADDHGFEAVYAGLFNELAANVSNGGAGVLALGADPGTTAGNWIVNVAGLMTPPQTVTFANNITVATTPFTGFAILHVPSDIDDTPGGINLTESGLLNARQLDVAAFSAAGGAVFGLTQGEFPSGWAYLTGVLPLAHRDAPPSGTLPSGNRFDDVAPTPEGRALGIDDTNVDGCCFHNVFTVFPPYLRVLATAVTPADVEYNGHAVFIGGLTTCVALPTLSVQFDYVTATRTDAAAVELSWLTLDESGTRGFFVYRSDNPDGIPAVPVDAFVVAHGSGLAYAAVDREPSLETAYYFVEERTMAGAGDRSQVIRVDAAEPDHSEVGGGARRRQRIRGTVRR